MKLLHKLAVACGLLALILLVYTSCRKDMSTPGNIPEGKQRIQIRLSDNPVHFDAVFVDIQKVEIKVKPDSCDRNNDTCAVWDSLSIRAGVYNLLSLANGTDTLLANGFTVAGNILELRLTLGTNNSVLIDSISYPLTLWNNRTTVTIKIRGEDVDVLSPNDLQLWLDFDAGRSIVKVSNNRFVLKPWLKVWVPARTASIEGRVQPGSARSVVAAVFNGDTLIAIPNSGNGKFKIRGINATSADIFINATANGYQDTTITGIQLDIGRTENIGTIHLHQ
jgi:hypothetical protein